MEEREDLFRDLCENTSDLVQSVSAEGRFLYVNRAWLETLGYTREEVPALSFADVVHPDSLEHCRTIFGELMGGASISRVEAEFRSKDGRTIPVEGSVSCRFEDGRAFATRGIFRDITGRRELEDERKRLFDLSLDMLCIAGTDGYFKQVNPAFERILGYDREELMSRQFAELIHPDDQEATRRQVENLAAGRAVVDFGNRYQAKDGAWHWLEWRSVPLPSRGLIYAVARDVTAQKEMEALMERQAAELARSNADLEQFAAAASHDLRAPLRTVGTLAEWIESDSPTPLAEKPRAHLRELCDRVARMQALIDDLLAYARVGREEGSVERVDTGELVRDVTSLLSPPAEMQVRADPGLPDLEAPRAPLELVFRNLIGNALKHHDRPQGTISVSASDLGPLVEFHVADDGPGVPPEFQDRAFEMFRQGRGAAGSGGSGMGLALVKRIVENHGGRVRLESAGRGTTISFSWPRHAPTDRPERSE